MDNLACFSGRRLANKNGSLSTPLNKYYLSSLGPAASPQAKTVRVLKPFLVKSLGVQKQTIKQSRKRL